jgi:hypothetical protein
VELTYARWLRRATRIALATLIGCFFVYLTGIREPLVPVSELTRLWTLPVDRFVAATGAPTGWNWLGYLGSGDYLNLVGVAMLGLVTVLCYARIVLPLLRSGERLYAALALGQIVVLLIAASGLPGAHG